MATLLVAVFACPSALAAPGDTTLESRATGVLGAVANDDSMPVGLGGGSVSDDGCRIAFASSATNLSAEDSDVNGQWDVFVRDRCTGETLYLSRADGQDGAPGVGSSYSAVISGDGDRVAFVSNAALDPTSDTNGTNSDVYVRDITTDDTHLVSFRQDTGQTPGTTSGLPAINDDGTVVAFASSALASEMISDGPNDANLAADVFVHDLSSNETGLVSFNAAGDATGNDASAPGVVNGLSIAGDGDSVAFGSQASDLVVGDINGRDDVFVRDLKADTTTLVSRTSGTPGALLDGGSGQATISGDGTVVAFQTNATNLPGDDDESDYFVRDLTLNTTELVTRRSGPNGEVSHEESQDGVAISTHGRFIAFASGDEELATGTVPGDPAPRQPVRRGGFGVGTHIFVRDRLNQTTALASRASGSGAGADNNSELPSIAGDGSVVAFRSTADNLTAEDTGGAGQIFAREQGEPSRPEEGRRVNVRPVEGVVRVNGKRLTSPDQIRVGAKINTRSGVVELTSEYNNRLQSAEFYEGLWRVQQTRGKRPTLFMKLIGSKHCHRGDGNARAQRRRRGRRGWGRGSGKYGSKGSRGSGSVRGTTWLTDDRCDGSTRFTVTEGGPLLVDDRGKRGKVNARLRAGERYTAKPKR